MTREEAEIVARIVGTADHGCSACVNALVASLNESSLPWKFVCTGKDVSYYTPSPYYDDEQDYHSALEVVVEPKT